MGDILTNVDLQSFLNFHVRKGGVASIVLKEGNTVIGPYTVIGDSCHLERE